MRRNSNQETKKALPRDLTLPLRWALECGHFTLLPPDDTVVVRADK